MTHPYRDLPDHQFWSRAVAAVEAHRIDPAISRRFAITSEDRVATAGSCFAQHIARALPSLGLTYFVTEAGEGLSAEERAARQFGLFSARYGNIYTPAQMLQLVEGALGHRQPVDRAWPGRNGGWVDPFRPSIEPGGFASPEAVARSRAAHLAAVRRMIDEMDVLVFTLGLTEAWRSRRDGSVFPLAPGVAGGAYDPGEHQFVNFTAAETEAALDDVLVALRAQNPSLRILLTVSPVPLAATYEPRHVLVSTAASKAALRVAADQVCRRYDWVDYFPSFEIITAPSTGGMYFEEDARSVNALGVNHVMRVFRRHYLDDAAPAHAPLPEAAYLPGPGDILCDEEMIELARRPLPG